MSGQPNKVLKFDHWSLQDLTDSQFNQSVNIGVIKDKTCYWMFLERITIGVKNESFRIILNKRYNGYSSSKTCAKTRIKLVAVLNETVNFGKYCHQLKAAWKINLYWSIEKASYSCMTYVITKCMQVKMNIQVVIFSFFFFLLLSQPCTIKLSTSILIAFPDWETTSIMKRLKTDGFCLET